MHQPFIALLLCCLFIQPVFFQKTNTSPAGTAQVLEETAEECGTDRLTALLYRKFPERRITHELQERRASEFFNKKMKNSGGESGAMPPGYVLPVVVHIIHQNGPENITDAQVLLGIQHLNDAFANINFYDQGTGVDTKIQFCMAKRDPNGNATTGINRVVSPLTNVDFGTDIPMKNLIRWNPLQYINIWLVKSINGDGLGWDGFFKGKPMAPAVFAWYARVRLLDGSEKIVKGDLTLIR